MSDDKINMTIKVIDRINKSFINLNKEQFELMENKKEFDPNIKLDCQNTLLLTIGLDILKSHKDLEILKENESRYNGFLKLIDDIEEKLYNTIGEDKDVVIDIRILQSTTYFLLMIENMLNAELYTVENKVNELPKS